MHFWAAVLTQGVDSGLFSGIQPQCQAPSEPICRIQTPASRKNILLLLSRCPQTTRESPCMAIKTHLCWSTIRLHNKRKISSNIKRRKCFSTFKRKHFLQKVTVVSGLFKLLLWYTFSRYFLCIRLKSMEILAAPLPGFSFYLIALQMAAHGHWCVWAGGLQHQLFGSGCFLFLSGPF